MYAKSILTEDVSTRPSLNYDAKFEIEIHDNTPKDTVLLEITDRYISNPSLNSVMKAYSIFKDFQVIQIPQGTNFRVTAEERLFIEDLLKTL